MAPLLAKEGCHRQLPRCSFGLGLGFGPGSLSRLAGGRWGWPRHTRGPRFHIHWIHGAGTMEKVHTTDCTLSCEQDFILQLSKGSPSFTATSTQSVCPRRKHLPMHLIHTLLPTVQLSSCVRFLMKTFSLVMSQILCWRVLNLVPSAAIRTARRLVCKGGVEQVVFSNALPPPSPRLNLVPTVITSIGQFCWY